MVQADEPPFLAVGTEVSAKYKGAFCEAKIKKISKNVKCKVQYSNGTTAFVTDESVKGPLKVGATVEVKSSDKKEFVEATIQKIQDYTQYTVVFDDGDITCLKRTALCLKSGKHFAASATLDQLPLTHPEHISTPVHNTIVYSRRCRKPKKSVGESGEEEVLVMEEKDIGKVVCVEANDKKKVRDNWFPGLVVAPTAQSSVKTNVMEDYLVRSFKDGKYYTVPKKEITEFTKEIAAKVENPTLKTAIEKAILYLDKDELPPHWDRDLLFGIDKNCVTTDSEGVYDSDNSDEESIEEKDHFVAQLFKFMDDRGTPLNQAPMINDKDVDLYKLFKVVYNFGGFNKVSKCKQWKTVAQKIGHEQSVLCVKQLYEQLLHSFEDFYRKLGCTMISNPRGVRSRSRFSRSIIRDVDKAQPGTSGVTIKQEPSEKKDKPETTVKENEVPKESIVVKKSAKTKSEDKPASNKSNDEPIKKNDKKKDDNSSNTSRNKQSVKWDADVVETKDSVKETKIKKEPKEPLIKEEDIKKEIEEKKEDENVDGKKVERKKYARNLFGKSMRKTTKKEKEKVEKVKSVDSGLTGIRKMRAIKEQIKTFVKVMTPFKKSKRGSSNIQQENSSKSKPDEDKPKLTRSKSKDDLPNRLRRVSAVLSDNTDSAALVPSTPSGSTEIQSKVKKSEDGSEKKKTVRKKKDDKDEKDNKDNKMIKMNTVSTPVSNAIVETLDKDSPVAVGDNLVVYYGDKQATTYDAKVLNLCHIEGLVKYYVHYKGWNSRYDEWIDNTRIASKSKPVSGLEQDPEHENDADSSKSEQKSVDIKKLPTSRTRRSVTPSMTNSQRKKSPMNSARPTRTCTLNDRPLSALGKYSIRENSDSESEYSGNLGLAKQYNKKSQQGLKTSKLETDLVVKTENVETDTQKKAFPKTYPSKEVLMQRSAPRKPKSSVLKVSDKSEDNENCEQVPQKPPFDINLEMPPPLKSNKSDLDNESNEIQNEDKNTDDVPNEPKTASIHYLSPKEKSEKNDKQQIVSDPPKSFNENDNKTNSLILPTKCINIVSDIYNSPPSSVNEEQIPPENTSEENEENAPPLLEKIDECKISGTDFDLNKIRSEMKGLMPTSTDTSSADVLHNSEFCKLGKQVEIPVPKPIEPVAEDVYEFKEQEPCDFETIPSVIEEKNRRVIIKNNDPPKLCSFDKPIEPPKIVESIAQVEAVVHNKPSTSFEPNSNTCIIQTHHDNVEIETKENNDHENLMVKNVIEDFISQNQSESESNESDNLLVINDTVADSTPAIETEEAVQTETCPVEVDESDKTDEVLDLCMKPPESPPNNIFSMIGINEDHGIATDDEEEDDDETKLVIAENDRNETDYQIDEPEVVNEEQSYSYGQPIDAPVQSLPPMPPSISQLTTENVELKNSYEAKRGDSLPKDIDDESTTSCNESVQNALIQSFKMYSNCVSLNKIPSYQPYSDNNDDSTKSGFEFESNSKSPTNEHFETDFNNCITKSINKDKPKEFYEKSLKIDKSKKGSSSVVPELQCKEQILDEETLNNALIVEYNRKNVEYDIHKPGSSKGVFDSIHQPGSSKDNFYETTTSSDTKNSFFESRGLIKSVIFDPNAPSTSKSGVFDSDTPSSSNKDSFYDIHGPSTSKSSFYDNPVPSTSKSFYNPNSDVNNVLFCEETIPGSPTGTTEEQYDQEERKRIIAQSIFEDREAASVMFSMNQAVIKPLTTTIVGTSPEESITFTNPNNEQMLDQRHLEFLAEVSARNQEIDMKPIINKPLESTAKQTKPPEKPATKRKISHDHTTSKRNKMQHSSTISTTGTEFDTERMSDIKTPMPLRDGKPLVTFSPDMDSSQRQALIVAKINDLRKEYLVVKSRIAVVDRRRKKIRKRKRELAKAATQNQNKQSVATVTAK